MREAAVKPAASDRVFSLDDVRKVVRQELFSAHRGRGRRGNGSERRRAGKQEYWVAEKRRRRVQASHERVRRRDSMLFRLVQPVVDVSLLLSRWRSRAHLPSLFLWWKETAAASARSVLLFAISRRVQTRQVQVVLRAFKWVLVGWRLNMVFRSGARLVTGRPLRYSTWSSLMRSRLKRQEQGDRWEASGMRYWEFMCSDLVPEDAEGSAEVFSSSGSGGCICWCSSGVVAGWMFVAVCVVTTHTLSFSGTRI